MPVRFAILGFGHHAARRLVPAFARTENAILKGFWRRDQSAAAEAAQEFLLESFPNRDALCASPEIDAVFITSPDAMHRDDALLAIRHGKAVLCEKPLAMNAAEAEEINDAAIQAGIPFGVAQNFRYNRSLEWLRDQVASGTIGMPQSATAQFLYPAQTAPRRWITDPTLATGGPIADVGVHCVDALRFVLGAEVLSVSTVATRDSLSGPVEATASLQVECSGALLATVTVSARAAYRTLLEMTGSEGVLTAENAFNVDRSSTLTHRRAGQVVESLTLDNSDGYVRMIDGFAQAIRGEGSFAAPGADGVVNQRILDAAYRSWHTGTRQRL